MKHTKISTAIVLCSLIAMLAVQLAAQDTNPPPAITNAPTIQSAAQQMLDAIKAGTSNWYFEAHGLYAPALGRKYGAGLGAFYPISEYLVTGLRLDYVDGGFMMPSGNATLQLPLQVFSWLKVTPFGYAGIGIPLSGANIGGTVVPGTVNNNGAPTAILGYGAAVHLWKSEGGRVAISAIADRETWSGFPGQQFRFGAMFKVKF